METEEIVKRGPGRPKMSQSTEADTMRNDMRHELREADPHEAAEKRAQEILAQLGDSFDELDEFFVPENMRHPDWTLEWKRWSVNNAEDQGYINGLLRTGWQFVSPKRPGFDMFLPRGWKEDFILKKGMVLMERPAQITELVNKRQLKNARDQVRLKQEQLGEAPVGTLPRQDSTGRAISAHGVTGAKRTIVGPIPD